MAQKTTDETVAVKTRALSCSSPLRLGACRNWAIVASKVGE